LNNLSESQVSALLVGLATSTEIAALNNLSEAQVISALAGLATADGLATVDSHIPDISGLATEVNAGGNRDQILLAIDEKPVTEQTDLTGVAKTTELNAVKLASDGLDSISVAEVTGRPATFGQYLLSMARRLLNRSKLTQTQLIVYKDDGVTPATTQTVSETTEEQNIGPV
jgi:hypothetical protein